MPRRSLDPKLRLTRILRWTLHCLEESLADAVPKGFLTTMDDLRQFRDRVPARSINILEVGRLRLRDGMARPLVPLTMEPLKRHRAPSAAAALQAVGKVEPELRVARQAGRAVTDPLTSNEDWQFHMELELAHLERRGVAVAHQVVDQSGVLADLLRARAVRHPRGLDDRGIVTHVVDDPDEPMVEDRDGLIEERLHRRHG